MRRSFRLDRAILPIHGDDEGNREIDPDTAACLSVDHRGDEQGVMAQEGLPRSFWILWAGTIVLRLGTVVQPFLAFYLTDSQGLSTTQTGAILAVIGVGGVLSQLVGGSLADRIGRRSTLTVSVLATGAVMVGLGYAQTTVTIVILAFALGLTLDMYRPASQAIIADVVPAEARARAFSFLVWAINLGFSIAMVLGGLLARQGFTLLCWANAITCVVFGVIAWFFIPETREPQKVNEQSEGFGVVLRDRTMMTFVLLLLAYSFVFMQAFSTLPLVMNGDNLPASTYGFIMAANGIVIITFQPFANHFIGRFDHHLVLAAGTAIVGLGYGLTAFASSAQSYTASVVVWSFGEIVVFAEATSIVAELSPRHLRGRYNGIYGMVWAGGSLLAPLCGSWLLELGGSTVLWLLCFGTCVLSAIGQLLLAPTIRQRTQKGAGVL